MSNHLLLFVCTGNLCRSPMAEYLLRERLGRTAGWEIRSAGLAAVDGLPASLTAVVALRELGIDLRPHQSRPMTRALVDTAALIVVMTAAHREQLRAMAPRSAEKTFLLRSFCADGDRGDVDDPIGLALDAYREVRGQIEEALPGLMDFMKGLQLE